jgi:hypothetical protein
MGEYYRHDNVKVQVAIIIAAAVFTGGGSVLSLRIASPGPSYDSRSPSS